MSVDSMTDRSPGVQRCQKRSADGVRWASRTAITASSCLTHGLHRPQNSGDPCSAALIRARSDWISGIISAHLLGDLVPPGEKFAGADDPVAKAGNDPVARPGERVAATAEDRDAVGQPRLSRAELAAAPLRDL